MDKLTYDVNTPHKRAKALQAELLQVRQKWRRSAGSPAYRSFLESEQTRLQNELRRIDDEVRAKARQDLASILQRKAGGK